jgi:hypothetical protein
MHIGVPNPSSAAGPLSDIILMSIKARLHASGQCMAKIKISITEMVSTLGGDIKEFMVTISVILISICGSHERLITLHRDVSPDMKSPNECCWSGAPCGTVTPSVHWWFVTTH